MTDPCPAGRNLQHRRSDDLIAEALTAGEKSGRVPWVRGIYGLRAWIHGDNNTAIRLIDESLRDVQDEWHLLPWWGVGALLRVVAGTDPEEAFGSPVLIGHHANWAARGYGTAYRSSATANRRQSQSPPITSSGIPQSTDTCCVRSSRRLSTKRACSRRRRAGCERRMHGSAAGERALQRRIRHVLGSIGARVPKGSNATVPPHLARLGITARETEILRLVNAGLSSNTEISHRLFISTRTVESHVSSMLQKTGRASREQLPSASTED